MFDKKTIIIIMIFVLAPIMTTPVFADDAPPPCPSLAKGYTIFSVNNPFGPWTAYLQYNGGNDALNDGGLIKTTASNANDARSYANVAQIGSIPSGTATKIGSSRWFWACSSSLGNYTLTTGVTEISVFSSSYGLDGKATQIQHSIHEKEQMLK